MERLSETELDALTAPFVHAADCIQFISKVGTIKWFNDAAGNAFDLNEGQIGSYWPDMWSRETGTIIRSVIRSDPVATQFLASRKGADGMVRPYDVAMVPFNSPDGEMIDFVATCHDVTMRETTSAARDVLLEEMRKRLAAMGRAQAVVARQEEGQQDVVELERLLATLVRPLVGPECDLVIDVEPGITLPAERVDDVVGLVLSELAVNSAKHGALLHGGRLLLSAVKTAAGIEFNWQERSDSDVLNHARAGGMGQRLMERFAKLNGGEFDITWRPRGQLARLILNDDTDHVTAA